jgi:hypothetical protein
MSIAEAQTASHGANVGKVALTGATGSSVVDLFDRPSLRACCAAPTAPSTRPR